ncbi:hypothetical protein [Candidatus Contubernalis alkaliaceticus]|uniref:hypothetical protein n=1 Tax=Candidatus Contubernalis alkaliaceticus TaxID=338645 RepID=UPI001F4BDF29|nr:hypothetical protein [Candidatus Contubernalis alkalaceticus]UNC92274.1 hypothetical protein HUE98_09305 [Candidatus Contubernalis alkalaceticus]
MKNRGITIILIFSGVTLLLLWLAPAEKTLGQWVKLIYFHSTLSYTGIYTFYAAGILGLLYASLRINFLGDWSLELGRSGLLIWAVSIVLSLISMQVIWGGLLLNEPRTIASIVLLGIGLGKEIAFSQFNTLIKSLSNTVFALIVFLILSNLTRIMHPDNPIRSSHSMAIRIYPFLLLVCTLAALFEFTRWRLSQK